MRLALLLLLSVAAAALVASPRAADSASPGDTVSTLLSCPNVDGSVDNRVLVGDILGIVGAYFNDWPSTNYVYMYDLVNPYNPENPTGTGQQRIDDILAVLGRYFEVCPLVDTQVAQATRGILTEHPELLTQDPVALAASGYEAVLLQKAPGQGVHYGNISLWDGTFDPAKPEGLVYYGGRLVAQLYVVNGVNVGWQPEDPGPNEGPCGDGIDNGGDTVADGADPDCVVGPPSGTPPHDVDIDTFAYCGPGAACSWNGGEGWHLHYRFCFVHVGTEYADGIALATGEGHAECKAIQDASCCDGTMIYVDRMGWMGHLWNWLPNANRVPDVNGTMNGRFADCFPDGGVWKAYNCPQ